jgi:hypothetical protein
MSKSNGGRISADWGATSASLTIQYNAKHSFPYYKMGRKIPVFVKGGAPKNNTDTSHGISVFSYGIYPTEFYGIDCLIPIWIWGYIKLYSKIPWDIYRRMEIP